MMNEAHDNMQRCIRTREIGRQILSTAHERGARYLAMEALWHVHLATNESQTIADNNEGYLSQPELRDFVQSALDLGWTLIAYETGTKLYLESKGLNPDYTAYSPEAWEKIVFTNEFWRWREQSGARNLADAFLALPINSKMLVWLGWQHHSRKATFSIDRESKEHAMGYYFEQMSQQTIFSIDQTLTLQEHDDSAWRDYASKNQEILHAFGGTAGFLQADAPPELRKFAIANGHDAYILSLDNVME